MRRFELSEGTSNKFWEIVLDGKTFNVRFGRIGTNGQQQAKSFPNAAKAKAEHDKLVTEKLGKGYREIAGNGHAAPAPVAHVAEPVAVPEGGGLAIKGYRVLLDAAFDYKIVNAAGNVLASVPDVVRKSPEWQQLIALRENHRQRLKENTRTIESWMLARRALSSARLAPLLEDPAWAKPLGSLFVESGDVRGFIVGADPKRGIGLMGKELETEWVKRDPWVIPHPLDIRDLAAWQQIASENGLAQGVLQLMRPIHRPDAKEANTKSTDRFSGREFSSTIQLSYAFNARAWAASRGTASRIFDGITAEFTYAANMEDYGDMNGECTTGDLVFFSVTAEAEDDDDPFARYYRKDKALPLKEVPPSIFSEACFDVDAVLSSIRK
jgi:predicted DNA-binding WGR domain protein